MDLNPFRLRIEAHQGIFEEKITLFDRKLQSLSTYEPTAIVEEDPNKDMIILTHQNNLEQKAEDLQTLVD